MSMMSGPFEYFDRLGTERGIRALNGRRFDFFPDASVREVVPQKHWRQLTGPRLTAICADTCPILHRVKTPTTPDRYSMMFVYSSTTPYYAFPHFMLPAGPCGACAGALAAPAAGVDARQRLTERS
jgi:hypothetical protein